MVLYLFTNNATTTLAAPITASATTLQLAAGTGSLFPSPSSGVTAFMVTLLDAESQTIREICMCTGRSGDNLTVVRGQEGTTASSYAVGDLVQSFITAGVLNNFLQQGTAAGGALAGTYGSPSLAINDVQNGTGVGQLGNQVKIGWSTAAVVKVTVDTTDLGYMILSTDTLGGVLSGTLPSPGFAANPSFAGNGSISGNWAASNINVTDAITAGGNVTALNYITTGFYYSSYYLLVGPTNGNLTPCQSAATGCSISGGQINAYNLSGSSGQFGTASAGDIIDFWVGNVGSISIQGKITTTGTGVVYGTTSDYRLKENMRPHQDAISTVMATPVYRLNYKSDPQRDMSGFLAHELQINVPEAVYGEKDAVNEDGSPDYQMVDLAKLVPVLWAAVQELSTKVARLEARR